VERVKIRRLRWIAFLFATAIGGGLAYLLGGFLVVLAQGESLSLLRLLVSAYGALAAGYAFSAGVSRVAPGRRYAVSVTLVFVTVIVAAVLMLGRPSDQSPIAAVLLGTSLVVGAFGHALRVRGFSEAVSDREG
jgi:hypothetical protein